jgi:outer membrane immunogenic protein
MTVCGTPCFRASGSWAATTPMGSGLRSKRVPPDVNSSDFPKAWQNCHGLCVSHRLKRLGGDTLFSGAQMTKAVLRGLALIALVAGNATAADLPVGQPVYSAPIVVPFSWSGFYLGGNIGGHVGNDSLTTTTGSGALIAPAEAAAIDAASPATLQAAGVMGGIQGGYNWQFGSAVVGFEADANWLGGTGSQSLAGISGAPRDSLTDSISSTFLLTARPRLGWAWDRTLVYVTGGYAWASVNVSDAAVVAGGTIAAGSSNSPHLNGWTVGAGIEYAFARSWSVKAEYLYVDLGTVSNSIALSGSDVITVNHRYTDNIARVGLNYGFGW